MQPALAAIICLRFIADSKKLYLDCLLLVDFFESVGQSAANNGIFCWGNYSKTYLNVIECETNDKFIKRRRRSFEGNRSYLKDFRFN